MKGKKWILLLRNLLLIVLAIGAVRGFLLTTCIIPSSGMENSLYEGEGIVVNKWSYGLRLPFPSFFGYHRIGTTEVRRGEIVIFNSPLSTDHSTAYEFHPFFISRCIGVPGDTLMLNNELRPAYKQLLGETTKVLFTYPMTLEAEIQKALKKHLIHDNLLVGYTPDSNYIRNFSLREYWNIANDISESWKLIPLDKKINTSLRPYVIPRKGQPVKVEKWNISMLCNAIRMHEHKEAFVRGDTLVVGGRPTKHYTFTQNYYWMSANDPMNLNDSRLFGLVPETHLIGKAWFIWLPKRNLSRLFDSIE